MGKIYIFRGKAATGKSTLANLLAKELSLPVFRKDDIIDGMKWKDPSQPLDQETCYNILCRLMQTNLDLGTSFILDAGLGDRRDAARFFSRLDFGSNQVYSFFTDCSDHALWAGRHCQRLAAPLLHENFQSLDEVITHYQKGEILPLEGECIIDSAQSVEQCFSKVLLFIEN